MATWTASGAARSAESGSAGASAVREAKGALGGRRASYGLVFASPRYDLREVLRAAGQAADGAPILGCTSAGQFTEKGRVDDGVVALLVASDASTAQLAYAHGIKAETKRVADDLTARLGEARKAAASRDQRHLTTLLLTDGLAGTGEKLVSDLYDRTQGGAQIVGGAAGDDGQFKSTVVGTGEAASTDAAAALHVFDAAPWGVGVNHGLRSTTKQMRVTRAEGNVVFELDGEPAFEAYKRHAAGRGVALSREAAGPYMIANELGIHFFDKISRARAPLSVGADGSLACAADIPKGSMVSILDGDPASMIDAAKNAAEEANDHLGGRRAAGVLLFDCVCRGMILKDRFAREIEAVRSVFGDVPVAGFLTYGEIARYKGKLDGWHNTTAVVTAIPA